MAKSEIRNPKSEITTKPGRPAGAKTQERPVVEETIDRSECGHCGSKSAPVNLRLATEGTASGTVNGKLYGHYQRFNCNCAKCGKAIQLIRYTLAE